MNNLFLKQGWIQDFNYLLNKKINLNNKFSIHGYFSNKNKSIYSKYFYTVFLRNFENSFLHEISTVNRPYNGLSIFFGRECSEYLQYCIKNNLNYLYVDHSYFDGQYSKTDNSTKLRIIFNHIHPHKVIKRDNQRIKDLNIKNWKKDGAYVLICPPTPFFYESYKDLFDIEENWLIKSIDIVRNNSDREIIIRPKPTLDMDKQNKNIEYYSNIISKYNKKISLSLNRSLLEDIDDAYAVVAPASAVSVTSIINGIPIFSSKKSPVGSVAKTNLEEIDSPLYPDRKDVLNHLSYCEFSLKEIESGYAWNILNDTYKIGEKCV